MVSISMALNTTYNHQIHTYIFLTLLATFRSESCIKLNTWHVQLDMNLCLAKLNIEISFPPLSKLAFLIVILISINEPPFTLMFLPKHWDHPLVLFFFPCIQNPSWNKFSWFTFKLDLKSNNYSLHLLLPSDSPCSPASGVTIYLE